MKHKATKRILSLLLAMVMLVGLLPTAAIPVFAEETAYTKAGEVGAVTAECEAFTEPELGAEIKGDFNFTVTSPTDQRVSITSGYSAYWEKLSYGLWEKYTEAAFNEGTYRLQLTMNSFAFSDGSYYALTSSTTLTLNDVSFTAGKLYDRYDSQGLGSLIFYSPEYTVTKEEGTYLVTVTAGNNGLASADKVYGKTGEVVTLTAQPYDGYRLKEWRVLSGGVTVENNRFTIGSEDVEIKAIFESSNENQGNITQVEVTKKEGVDYRPVMGRSPERIFVTIESSTPSDDTLGVGGYGYGRWQVKQPDGSWEYCMDEPFTYGTYRMCISLDNKVVDGTYHALTKDTVLIVDGEAWTADPYSYVNYYGDPNGRGEISFNSPEMDVVPLANVSDSTPVRCYVKPTLGEFVVPLGDDFSFTVEPKDYYELTDPDALKVYVNDILVTPDEDGVYTVENVTEDLDIYCDGSAFTSYSNLTITANGKTVTEKIFNGGTYTFKTLAEFGATVPENSTFTGWKIGGKTYQPGETYTVPGGTEIAVNAAFTGLHTITVENGKAYADEAHTIPISAAAEDQVIYIVADPAPEGKVFSYWSHQIATAGGGGSFGNYDAAQTTYKVYYSDVVLTPVYETQIDNIVINGMTKPSAGVAIDNSDYSYKWGCSVPADAGYTLGICYWYDITDGEPEFAMSSGDVFQTGHTYRFKARIHLKADHIYPANPEDIAVVLSGIDAEDYQCTINEVGYSSATIYFEFTCEREEPDTALICPKGDGTSGNPFQITNIGELYWFAAFVNGTASYPDGVTVERSEACAIVMNDITVNPELLTEDGELNGTSGFAQWTPIGYNSNYSGTFDGQEHTISGIYYAPQASADYRYGGFFSSLSSGGCIRNLTLADSYFRAPAKNSAYTGAFVGYIGSSCTVENCHFDGTVTTAITADSSDADQETYQYVYIAGIAGNVTYGEIRGCTARGLISGYGSEIGGIAAYVSNCEVTGCVNEATVETPNSWGDIGGIAGRLYKGIIRDCCNKGNVIGRSSAGIVSNVEGTDGEVIRCWNEGKIEGSYGSGIVLSLMGSVKNCYNTGSVDEAGIAGTAYSGSSVAYCHNVGEITGYMGAPICSVSSGSNITIENCYYLADSETDSVDGTTYKTADQFANQDIQMATKLLNSGENAGNWKQGDGYPVLAQVYTLTVNGGTGSGTYGVGTEVTVTAEVPDGYVFAGWDGIDGLIVEAGQPAEDSVSTTFLMPKRDVTLTAKFVSTTPVRPTKGDGTPENPFQITNIGELYWFAAFVNGTASYPDGVTVERSEACAIVMNDITVNYELLKDDGTVNGSSGFVYWIPIGFYSNYSGTFDGQNHTISGLLLNHPDAYAKYGEIGFVAELTSGGCIRDLTIADSLFAPPISNKEYFVGGIVGRMWAGTSVINCHFQGTIRANTTYYLHTLGGIAGCSNGTITDCTSRGWIKGYSNGGAGGIVGNTYGSGVVRGCVNYASVVNELPSTYYGGKDSAAGGIVAVLNRGTVRDCCNKGDVSGEHTWVGGIVGRAEGWENQWAYIIRCWNEGSVNYCGIAGNIYRYTTVENCYNAGTVQFGITSVIYEVDTKVLYCHNAKAETANPIIGKTAPAEIANCYYMADSELYEIDGTTYKTADQFADGTVLALLDNGHWTQGEDDEYPVLGDAPGVTVSGMVTSFGEESEKTTVQLFPSGSDTPAFSVTLTGTHAMYSFTGVEAGTYTMKVSKANHVTREYTVVVGNSPIPLDAKIFLKGDLDGDGSVSISDVTTLLNVIAGKTTLQKGVDGDLDADGSVSISDVTKLLNVIAGKTTL